ncbi:MAG: hypothetical protein NT015_11460 [Alphaproteobacteria bacterium]|nr:hypothetical protein [Alphaproteobacteria bacterium]
MPFFVNTFAIAVALYAIWLWGRKSKPTLHALWIVPVMTVVLYIIGWIGVIGFLACCATDMP